MLNPGDPLERALVPSLIMKVFFSRHGRSARTEIGREHWCREHRGI